MSQAIAVDSSGEPESISYAVTFSGPPGPAVTPSAWRADQSLRISGDEVVVPLRRNIGVTPAQNEALWNALRKSATLVSAGHYAGDEP